MENTFIVGGHGNGASYGQGGSRTNVMMRRVIRFIDSPPDGFIFNSLILQLFLTSIRPPFTGYKVSVKT